MSKKPSKLKQFLQKIGKSKIADAVTGGILGDVMDLIIQDTDMSEIEKEYAIHLLEQEVALEKEISKRHSYDMQSDSALSKSIRPLLLVFLTVSTVLLATADSLGLEFNVEEHWVSLLQTLLITAYSFYFGSRGLEKVSKIRR